MKNSIYNAGIKSNFEFTHILNVQCLKKPLIRNMYRIILDFKEARVRER